MVMKLSIEKKGKLYYVRIYSSKGVLLDSLAEGSKEKAVKKATKLLKVM